MEKQFEKDAFNDALKFVPYIDDLFNEDAAIAITDTEKYLYVKQARTYSLPYKENDELNETMKKGIKEGRVFTVDIPRGISKYDCVCHVYPLRENNKVAGLLIIAINLENRNRLVSIIDQFTTSISQITGGMKEVAYGSEDLAAMNT